MILPGSCNIIVKMLPEMCFLFTIWFMAQGLFYSVFSTGYFHALCLVHFLIAR